MPKDMVDYSAEESGRRVEESTRLRLAEAIRKSCLDAALSAYHDALMRGLCHDGAWECATGAIRSLDLDDVLNRADEHTSR